MTDFTDIMLRAEYDKDYAPFFYTYIINGIPKEFDSFFDSYVTKIKLPKEFFLQFKQLSGYQKIKYNNILEHNFYNKLSELTNIKEITSFINDSHIIIKKGLVTKTMLLNSLTNFKENKNLSIVFSIVEYSQLLDTQDILTLKGVEIYPFKKEYSLKELKEIYFSDTKHNLFFCKLFFGNYKEYLVHNTVYLKFLKVLYLKKDILLIKALTNYNKQVAYIAPHHIDHYLFRYQQLLSTLEKIDSTKETKELKLVVLAELKELLDRLTYIKNNS